MGIKGTISDARVVYIVSIKITGLSNAELQRTKGMGLETIGFLQTYAKRSTCLFLKDSLATVKETICDADHWLLAQKMPSAHHMSTSPHLLNMENLDILC